MLQHESAIQSFDPAMTLCICGAQDAGHIVQPSHVFSYIDLHAGIYHGIHILLPRTSISSGVNFKLRPKGVHRYGMHVPRGVSSPTGCLLLSARLASTNNGSQKAETFDA